MSTRAQQTVEHREIGRKPSARRDQHALYEQAIQAARLRDAWAARSGWPPSAAVVTNKQLHRRYTELAVERESMSAIVRRLHWSSQVSFVSIESSLHHGEDLRTGSRPRWATLLRLLHYA